MIRDPLGLSAVVALATALAFWLDHKVPALSKVGASLLAIVLGALLSNLALVPASSGVYDVITGPITSLAIAWLLLSVNLAEVKRAGPRMLAAYGLAALGTMLGAFTASLLFAGVFGADTWRLGGTLTGTYTGGSLNFVSVGRAVDLPDRLFAGATAADNLTTGLWMGATLLLPVWLGRFFPPLPSSVARARADEAGSGVEAEARHPFFLKEAVSTLDLALLAAIGFALLLVSAILEALIPVVPSILWLTTLALVVAHTPGFTVPRGAFQLGTLALHLFFVVIGIFSRASEILAVGIEVFWMTLVVVAIHGVVVYGGGRLARLDVGSLSVASQAAVGGPSSALAVAVSREWTGLVLPGIMVGLLGYAAGNYLGLAVSILVRSLGIGL